MKKYLWGICYGLAITAFTAYVSLDTFVISSRYQENAGAVNSAMFADIPKTAITSDADSSDDTESSQPSESENSTSPSTRSSDTVRSKRSGKRSSGSAAPVQNDSSSQADESSESSSDTAVSSDGSTVYEDDNIRITLTEYYQYDTKIYAADIRLSSAEYLKAAFADDTYGKNVTARTSETAAAHNAILAVNGDYYGAQERGYVIRNGVVYRSTPSSNELLCIYADGTMKVIAQQDKTAEELVAEGVWQAFSFGPALIENGSIAVTESEEVGKAMASNPRTAIGMIGEGHYVMVVSDGRTDESEGLSLHQLAEFMQGLGAETAYNLDGGGSSTMYLNGQVINNPTSSGNIKERKVSDIVYIGY